MDAGLNSKTNYEMKTEFNLAKNVIKILDKKGRAGCINKSWEGYCNGNGTEIGTDIERLIRQAKRILKIQPKND